MANKKTDSLSSLCFIKFEQLVIVADYICSTFLRGKHTLLSHWDLAWSWNWWSLFWQDYIFLVLSESRVPKFLSLANEMWAEFKMVLLHETNSVRGRGCSVSLTHKVRNPRRRSTANPWRVCTCEKLPIIRPLKLRSHLLLQHYTQYADWYSFIPTCGNLL